MMQNNLKYGPLNKSLFTQKLELVAKSILHMPEKINFSIIENEQKQALHVQIGNHDINLSALFKRANFSHIHLDTQDSIARVTQDKLDFPYLFDPKFQHEKLNFLSFSEKMAIKAYTDSELNHNITSLLNDRVRDSMGYSSDYLQTKAKQTVLNIIFLASGLNKIPPSEIQGETYRGEGSVPCKKIIARYIGIQEGNDITEQHSFMSTSNVKEVAQRFEGGSSFIVFDEAYGKEIAMISDYEGESEFLINPGMILWESVKMENDHLVFHAKIVSPLVDGKDEVTEQDLQEFKDLWHFAKEQGVHMELTAHLSQQIHPFTEPTLEPLTPKADIEGAVKFLYSHLKSQGIEVQYRHEGDKVELTFIKPGYQKNQTIDLQDCLDSCYEIVGLENNQIPTPGINQSEPVVVDQPLLVSLHPELTPHVESVMA